MTHSKHTDATVPALPTVSTSTRSSSTSSTSSTINLGQEDADTRHTTIPPSHAPPTALTVTYSVHAPTVDNVNTTEVVRTRSMTEIEYDNGIEKKITSSSSSSAAPYTMLTKWEKRTLIAMIAFIGMFSAIAQPIYFPILPVLQDEFNVSAEMLNLSVVTYLILQGLSPTLVSNFADRVGRRPVILLCLVGYIGANTGLALANTYWLILLMRCCQSGAIAPVVSISSAVVGDVIERAERGSYIGMLSGIILVGQGFGALIGAALASSKFGWRAIFWFLVIAPGATLALACLLLPETKRSIVGNLSVSPRRFINKAPVLSLPRFKKKLVNQTDTILAQPKAFDLLAAFKIMLLPEVACALFPSSIIFTTWTMSLTSYTTILSDDYHYKTLHIGLCYLPAGLGALIGSLTCGKVLDYMYKWEKRKSEDKQKFNIYKARLQLFIVPSAVMGGFTLIFGWTLQKHCNISIIIISAFCMAFSATSPITMCTTILVDIFPGRSSTSTSAVNFSRCMAAAVGVAALSRMTDAMGVGGCYTFMAALCLIGNVFIYWVVYRGQHWAENRRFDV